MKKHKNHWTQFKKPQILQIITGLTIVVLTATTLLISAAGTVVLYVSPATKSATVNDTFIASIRVNSQSERIGYVKAYLNFPSDKLSVVSISASGSGFGSQIEQTFSNSSGTIRIQRSGSRMDGDRLVATITFRAKASGSAIVSYSNASDAKSSSSSGGSKLTSTSSATYRLTAAMSPIPPPVPAPASSPLPSAPVSPAPGPSISQPAAPAPGGSPASSTRPVSEPAPIVSIATEQPAPEQNDTVADEESEIESPSGVLAESDNTKITAGIVIASIVGLIAAIAVAIFLRRRLINARALAAHTANLTKSAPPPKATGPSSIGPVVMPGSYVPTEIITPAPESLPVAPEAEEPPPPPPVEFKEIDPLKPDGQPKDMFEMAEERFEQDKRMEEFREDNPPKSHERR